MNLLRIQLLLGLVGQAVRFLQLFGTAMEAAHCPGYFVAKFDLCSSTWLAISRPRRGDDVTFQVQTQFDS